MASTSPSHGISSRAISPFVEEFHKYLGDNREQFEATQEKVANWGVQNLPKTVTGLPFSISITRTHTIAKVKAGADNQLEGTHREYKRAVILTGDRAGEVLARKVAHNPTVLAQEDLEREFAILKKLRGCRGIVQVEDLVKTKNKYNDDTWILYEQNCELGDLYGFIARGKTFAIAEHQVLIKDLLEGLNHVHANSCVHRDIKPENIFLYEAEGSPRAVLGDFNTARMFESENDAAFFGEFEGSLEFASPEKLREFHSGGWTYKREKTSDVYSLGLLLYFMRYGAAKYVFRGKRWGDRQRVTQILLSFSLRTYFPETPPENTVDWMIYQMLQPEAQRSTISQTLELWNQLWQR